MTKTLIAALFATTLLTGMAAAQDAPQQRRDPMARADANQDGIVTRDEFLAQVDQRFARLDANKDGKITAEERAAIGGGMGGRGSRGAGADGIVTLADQRAQALRRFDRLDRNADGKVDQAERDAAMAAMAN